MVIIQKRLPHAWIPYVIYADFESMLEPIDPGPPNDQIYSTSSYQHHKANGFSFNVLCYRNILNHTGNTHFWNSICHYVDIIESGICTSYLWLKQQARVLPTWHSEVELQTDAGTRSEPENNSLFENNPFSCLQWSSGMLDPPVLYDSWLETKQTLNLSFMNCRFHCFYSRCRDCEKCHQKAVNHSMIWCRECI